MAAPFASSDDEESHTVDTDEDPDTSDDEDFRGVSLPQMTFNVTKGIVGEGMLSLPAGIAAGTGVFPGIAISVAFYLLLMYTYWSIGRVCEATGEKTHRGTADRLGQPRLGLTMSIVNILKTTATCIAYGIVIGDNSRNVLLSFGVPGDTWYSSRQSCYGVILLFILVPLCLPRDLTLISYTSLLGVCFEVGVVVFMVIRWADGSYQEGGQFYDSTPVKYRPDFGESGRPEMLAITPATMVLIGSLSTAFLAHYNAPKFYHQLRDKNSKRFGQVTFAGFTIALFIYLIAMLAGYLTFGKHTAGNCLNDYSSKDILATFARSAMLLAVIFGFPIAFTGLRDATLQTSGLESKRGRVWVPLTFGLLTMISAVTCAVDELGILNSLLGALLGSTITIIMPALLIYYAFKSKSCKGDFTEREGKSVAPLLLMVGVLLVIFGTSLVVCVKMLKIL